MRSSLEEQIRRYTETVDAMATPLEDLAPLATTETIEVEPGRRVEVVVPLAKPARRPFPGWTIAVAAAVAVIVLAIPLWLALGDSDSDVVATTAPTPVTTTAADAGVGAAFVAVDIAEQPRVNGMGWSPVLPVSVSFDGGVSWIDLGSTDSAGRLDFALPFAASVGAQIAVDVGGAVTDSTIPLMSLTDLDEQNDRVVGVTDLPPEASCCLSVFMFTDPADNEAEEFSALVRPDGTWIADLGGLFDVTNFTLVDVSYGDPNGLWMSWSLGHVTDG